MDKKDKREKLNNIIIVFFGVVLVIGLLIFTRGGLSWFTDTSWSKVSNIKWVSIAVVLCVSLVLQFYFLLLLRYSSLKFLVLWLIPIIWVVNNGLAAVHLFLEWTADYVSPAGWIPVGDLISWMFGAVYFPLLIGAGMIVALIDSSSFMLTQACYYAGIAVDAAGISPRDIIDYGFNFISVFWDLISDSFVKELALDNIKNRSLWDFNLTGISSLPNWFFSVSYSFTCMVV
jgi:hypothetical protein